MPSGVPGNLEVISRTARRRLLQMHYESGVGHIGGNLSAIDLLLYLYHCELKPEDLFVLSKGHSAGALYIALWTRGILEEAELKTFHGQGVRLSGHPPAHGIPEIPFATGSLGHGVGLAAGAAMGLRLQGKPGRVFCLTSDGEWNEGSNWEALIFAGHHSLDNLTLLVDANGLQGFGTTSDVARISPLAEKFSAFGFETAEVDGHDYGAISSALGRRSTRPRAIVAATVKGRGVSFMENRMEWHYLPMTEQQYRRAVSEVSAECETLSAAL